MKPSNYSAARGRSATLFTSLALLVSLTAQPARADALYTVRQTFTVTNLPEGAKQVRGWFWMPEDRPGQRVLEFRVVKGPESVRITRDPTYGRSWVYAEIAANPQNPLQIVTEFKLVRQAINGMADKEKASPVSDQHRCTFAAESRLDESRMEATPAIKAIADKLAGDENNPVVQARKFFDYVIQKSDHYSQFRASPQGKCLGDAMECLVGAGDCCTDQHALFIALCRARGIPCRLVFGSRMKPENAGKDHDPGYRCWPYFFAPDLGWVPLDISSGDTAGDRASQWFGGLDENRIEWAEGRNFDLEPRSKVRPDLVIRGWVEVDGTPHKGLERVVNFQVWPASTPQHASIAPTKSVPD